MTITKAKNTLRHYRIIFVLLGVCIFALIILLVATHYPKQVALGQQFSLHTHQTAHMQDGQNSVSLKINTVRIVKSPFNCDPLDLCMPTSASILLTVNGVGHSGTISIDQEVPVSDLPSTSTDGVSSLPYTIMMSSDDKGDITFVINKK